MHSNKLNKLIQSALFAALCCIGTMILHIPTANGYLHPGDGFVFLSGLLLGPLYGGLAAGIGSCLADLFTGYVSYVLPTFLLKGLAALIAGSIFYLVKGRTLAYTKKTNPTLLIVILSCILGAIPIVGGYFLYDAVIIGLGPGAISGIPGNLIQTGFGTILACILYPILYKIALSFHR